MKNSRTTNKKLYCSNFEEMFKQEMAGTIWTEEGYEKLTKTYAETHYYLRKDEIENKADALMYGILDAKKYSEKIRIRARE